MKTYPVRQCKACGDGYQATGPAAKFCPGCYDFRKAVSAMLANRLRTIRRGGVPDVGSGGQNEGPAHSQKYRAWFLMDVWHRQAGECHDCWELISPEAMLLHHIDHDRQHNTLDNLHGVCKRCHQIEHKCWLAFKKV